MAAAAARVRDLVQKAWDGHAWKMAGAVAAYAAGSFVYSK
jgi:hypothetical protein